MANTRKLRRRIRSIRNTAQITKAMEMVAASKMPRAQQLALAGRPYARLMNDVLRSCRSRMDPSLHPLLARRKVEKRCVLYISTDKGLCGSLNANLAREALKLDRATTSYVTIGRKGRAVIARTQRHLLADFEMMENPNFGFARTISRMLMESFRKSEIDQIDVLYARFESTLSQQPMLRQLLPAAELAEREKASDADIPYEFEPNPEELLNALLPHYISWLIYQLLLSAKASEHSARMVAMKNATDNARELVDDLTLAYNKIRQAGITSEILEIATASMAME